VKEGEKEKRKSEKEKWELLFIRLLVEMDGFSLVILRKRLGE